MVDEPVASRQERLLKATDLMLENRVNGTFSAEQAKMLDDAIKEKRGWVVGIVSNATKKAVSVEGRTIGAGRSSLFRHEHGLPSEWKCVVAGYEDISLPADFEGRTVAIVDGDLVPRAVSVRPAKLDSGVACRVDGEVVPTKGLMLKPGEYQCEYSREDYETQKSTFTVEVAKERLLPPCGTWVATAGLKALEEAEAAARDEDWSRAADLIMGAAVVSQANRARKATLEENVANAIKAQQEALAKRRKQTVEEIKALVANEPVETRQSRLAEAMSILDKSEADGVLPASQAADFRKDVENRRRWVVGIVSNEALVDVMVGGRPVAAGGSALLAFADGLPSAWSLSAVGYETKALDSDFDGRKIVVTQGDLVPRAVEMRLPKLEDGVSCIFGGQVVTQPLRLRPGAYSCRYSRRGYEDQDVSFSVNVGENGSLPRPRAWVARPVVASVPLLEAGVVCRIDGKPAQGQVKLMPGDYRYTYERPDYKTQSNAISIVADVDAALPPPGEWEPTDGLKKLREAEGAVVRRDWGAAKSMLDAATVNSPENKRRKDELAAVVEAQARLQTSIAEAEVHLGSESYYEGVRLYFDAASGGYVVDEGKRNELVEFCQNEIARLTGRISYYRQQIDLGRKFVGDLREAERKKADFIKWKTFFSQAQSN